jgi:hypothetical protein
MSLAAAWTTVIGNCSSSSRASAASVSSIRFRRVAITRTFVISTHQIGGTNASPVRRVSR